MMPSPTMVLTKLAQVPRMEDFFSSWSVAPLLFRRSVFFLMHKVRVPWGVDIVSVSMTGLEVEGRKNGEAGLFCRAEDDPVPEGADCSPAATLWLLLLSMVVYFGSTDS